MTINKKRIIFAILMIASFTAIFVFSSQNGDLSEDTSKGFTRKILEILQIGKNLSEQEMNQLIENSQHIIRKLAHFTIYSIAGINIFLFINTYDIKWKNKLFSTLLIGMTYATLDEIHQMFSGDRTPAILDVFIDASGVLMGIFIYIVVAKSIKKRSKRRT